MTDRERLIDKISKLHAKAQSAQQVSSEAEAQAFAAKVQELLTKHKIEEAELRAFAPVDDEKDPIVEILVPHGGHSTYAGKKSTAEGFPLKRRRVQWSEMLASMVAKANYCRIAVVTGRNSLFFIGRRLEAQASVDTFLYLVAVAERLAWVEYQKFFDQCAADGVPEMARGFRASFLLGFVARLGQRYDEHVRTMRDAWLKDTRALVVLTDAVEDVKKHMESKKFSRAASLEMTVTNDAGWNRGREVAEGVRLSGEAERITA